MKLNEVENIISVIENIPNLRAKKDLVSFIRFMLDPQNKDIRFWQGIAIWCKWGYVILARSRPLWINEGTVAWREEEIRDPHSWEETINP